MIKFFIKQNKQKGSSLLETIIYIAIFGIISIAVISSSVVVINSFSNTRVTRNMLESGNTAMERMTREIRQATSIDIANSSLGVNPGYLQLNTVDSLGAARVVKFSVTNGILNLYQGATNPPTLTDSLLGQNITVSNLVFRRISIPTGEAVKIEMTLLNNSTKNPLTRNFYDTVILRGGY